MAPERMAGRTAANPHLRQTRASPHPHSAQWLPNTTLTQTLVIPKFLTNWVTAGVVPELRAVAHGVTRRPIAFFQAACSHPCSCHQHCLLLGGVLRQAVQPLHFLQSGTHLLLGGPQAHAASQEKSGPHTAWGSGAGITAKVITHTHGHLGTPTHLQLPP